MAYIISKATRIYVHPEGEFDPTDIPATDSSTFVADLLAAGWVFVRGVRSDQAQNTANATQFYHYGEPDAVSITAPPDRTFTIPVSEDLADEGQSILRWANIEEQQIGVMMLKDGRNGYAVTAGVGGGEESGEAQGGLRSAGFTINPVTPRIAIGVSGLYEPDGT
jgi:hypothetical protein